MQAAQKGISRWRLITVVAGIGAALFFLGTVNAWYANYGARSQMDEAVRLLDAAKTPVAQYYADKRRWPGPADKVMPVTGGKYTDRLEIATGAGAHAGTGTITATMKTTGVNAMLQGRTVQMSSPDGKSWTCRPGTDNGVEPIYLPAACRP